MSNLWRKYNFHLPSHCIMHTLIMYSFYAFHICFKDLGIVMCGTFNSRPQKLHHHGTFVDSHLQPVNLAVTYAFDIFKNGFNPLLNTSLTNPILIFSSTSTLFATSYFASSYSLPSYLSNLPTSYAVFFMIPWLSFCFTHTFRRFIFSSSFLASSFSFCLFFFCLILNNFWAVLCFCSFSKSSWCV